MRRAGATRARLARPSFCMTPTQDIRDFLCDAAQMLPQFFRSVPFPVFRDGMSYFNFLHQRPENSNSLQNFTHYLPIEFLQMFH